MSKMKESFGDVAAIAVVLFMLYAAGSTIVQAVSKIPEFEETVTRVWPADYRLWSTESERMADVRVVRVVHGGRGVQVVHEVPAVCTTMAEAAAVIMDARQTGVSMTTLMNIAHAADPAEVAERGKAMVLDAYSQKREHSEEYQQFAVDAFKNTVYQKCEKN